MKSGRSICCGPYSAWERVKWQQRWLAIGSLKCIVFQRLGSRGSCLYGYLVR